MPRIISLLPSSTEIVATLGLQSSLIGRSHECDFPLGVENLPVLTAPKFNTDRSSAEIDNSVIDLLKDGLSVYNIDQALLQQLKPDFIITQSQCDICAVSLRDVEQAVCNATCSNPVIINLEPNVLEDILSDIDKVGKMLNVPGQSKKLIGKTCKRMAKIRAKSEMVDYKPRVAMIEWLSPLMLGGNWIPQLVETAGGESILAVEGEHSHYFKWEDIAAQDPDCIVIMPCGFSMDRSLSEIDSLTSLPGWQALKAVKNKKVFITDGNHYFNRPGPRIVESAQILAEICHPDLFSCKYLGKGYIPL